MTPDFNKSFESDEPCIVVVNLGLDPLETLDFFVDLRVEDLKFCDFIRQAVNLMNEAREDKLRQKEDQASPRRC